MHNAGFIGGALVFPLRVLCALVRVHMCSRSRLRTVTDPLVVARAGNVTKEGAMQMAIKALDL